MKPLLLALVVVGCLDTAVRAQELAWARSPSGRWFGYAHEARNWGAATSTASALTAQLATIRSAQESAWLIALIEPGSPIANHWIGLGDLAVDGTFAWVSGEPLAFTSWASNEPNLVGPGGVMQALSVTTASWYDVALGTVRPFLVDRAAIPPSGWRWPRAIPQSGGGDPPASGDLDGDGRDDLIVHSSWPSASGLAYLRGRADGELELPVAITVPADPRALAVADFDRDGWLDIAIAHGYPSGPDRLVSVLFGDPALAFTRRTSWVPPGVPGTIAAGDVDGDGDPDLVVGHAAQGTTVPGVTVLASNGLGAFAHVATYDLPQTPTGIAVADLEPDLDLDWVVRSGAALIAFRNDGTGASAVQVSTPNSENLHDLALADFDADGRPDVAFARATTSSAFTDLLVSRGDGAGGFTFPWTLALRVAGTTAVRADVQLVDFDGNGFVDPCMSVDSTEPYQQVVTARNLGAMQFGPTSFLAASHPYGLAAGDFDGDGRVELAATGQGIVIHRRLAIDCNGNGVEDAVDVERGTSADLDGDGGPDECQETGVPACFGDGTGTACPCGNASIPGDAAGCLHSFGLAGRLRAHGVARVSADSLRLSGDAMTSSTALYFQGTALAGGGSGAVFGDGLRCAAGSVVRLATRTNVSGASALGHGIPGDPLVSQAGGVPASGGIRHYQVWYRNAAAFCSASTFNLTNACTVDWGA